MSVLKRVDRAVLLLRLNYELAGLNTFPVSNPQAHAPYRVGVALDWPNKPDSVVERQQERVQHLADSLGRVYGLEVCVQGPTWAAGGAKVMYVGFNARTA